MRRLGRWAIALALVGALGSAAACQRTVEVQTGTRVVDSQGRVISEDIKTVKVPAETAGAYRINTITQPDAPNAQVATLYDEAQAAIAAGDLKTAEQKLGQVLSMVADYRSAKKQADAIKNGEKVTPDTTASKPTTTTAPATSTPKPTAGAETGLARWAPDAIAGFTADAAAVDPITVTRQYIPTAGSSVRALTIVAEQFRNSTAAKRALTNSVKQRYPDNSSTVAVNGHTVYFGTYGGKFAAMAFTKGSTLVALEMTPKSGSALSMKADLLKVVRQLP
jgi:hypothetical protein